MQGAIVVRGLIIISTFDNNSRSTRTNIIMLFRASLPLWQVVPRFTCGCCIFEHIAHALECGGVEFEGRKGGLGLQFTTDHRPVHALQTLSSKRLRHLVYQIGPPLPRHYFLLLHGIVALFLRELLRHIGCGP